MELNQYPNLNRMLERTKDFLDSLLDEELQVYYKYKYQSLSIKGKKLLLSYMNKRNVSIAKKNTIVPSLSSNIVCPRCHSSHIIRDSSEEIDSIGKLLWAYKSYPFNNGIEYECNVCGKFFHKLPSIRTVIKLILNKNIN